MVVPASLTAATVFALSGILLSYVYYRSIRLRESPRAQWITLVLILLLGGFCAGSSGAVRSIHQLTFEGFVFLGASLCHAPVLVYILLSRWNHLLEYLTSPGSRKENPQASRTESEEWAVVTRHLEALRESPVDPYRRRQLAESYLRLGLVDSAIGELRKAIECADRGYEQAYLLFKSSRLLVDEKDDIPAALPLLRRTIRLYPKSYFAAYARRIVNHYDAHGGSGGTTREFRDTHNLG